LKAILSSLRLLGTAEDWSVDHVLNLFLKRKSNVRNLENHSVTLLFTGGFKMQKSKFLYHVSGEHAQINKLCKSKFVEINTT